MVQLARRGLPRICCEFEKNVSKSGHTKKTRADAQRLITLILFLQSPRLPPLRSSEPYTKLRPRSSFASTTTTSRASPKSRSPTPSSQRGCWTRVRLCTVSVSRRVRVSNTRHRVLKTRFRPCGFLACAFMDGPSTFRFLLAEQDSSPTLSAVTPRKILRPQ